MNLLQIWIALESENFVLATYLYFYGINIYKSDIVQNSKSIEKNLFYYNGLSLNDLNDHIVQFCWRHIIQKSIDDDFDDSNFADIFTCILLLKNYQVPELIEDFLFQQISNVVQRFDSGIQLFVTLEQVLNIIFNTIRCSKIFYENSDYDALIWQRFKRIISTNYSLNTISFNRLPDKFANFKISQTIDKSISVPESSISYLTKEKAQQWILTVKQNILNILIFKNKQIDSITEIFYEFDTLKCKLIKNRRFIEWEDYKEILDINLTIWQECFINVFEERVYEISNKILNLIIKEFSSLIQMYNSCLRQCDLNIVEFVWKDPSFTKNNDFVILTKKCCDIINNQFKTLFDNLIVLKADYQTLLSKIYSNVFELFNSLKQSIDSQKETLQFILFGAVLFKKILELCPFLHSLFDIQEQSNDNLFTWTSMEKSLINISNLYLCQWFNNIIEKHFENTNSTMFVDLCEFIENFTLWENVTIVDNQDNNASKSTIEVPMHLSLATYNILQNICSDINRYCAYNVPRSVLLHILSILGHNLLNLYNYSIESIISDKIIPKPAKQTMSLQLYFDLIFMKRFFALSKDDSFSSEQIKRINNLMTQLETMIDPFDLHILFPYIQINSDKFLKSCYILFGFLFDEKNVLVNLKINPKQNDILSNHTKHNIMLVHSCEPEIHINS